MRKGNILVIDDDENLRIVLEEYLADDGYNVKTAENVLTALEQAKQNPFDVILLDLTLPDGEGLTLIPQLKSIANAQIIVVSGKTDTMEKVVCLEMGADDYITKPFEMRELAARIKAVLRRNVSSEQPEKEKEPAKADHVKFENGWYLDRSQYQLYDNKGESAGLTTGEFQLLEALVDSSNRTLSREQLFDLTRDGKFDSYDRAIDIQIARLRKKMGDDTKNPTLIKTVRGIGYMFSGNITNS